MNAQSKTGPVDFDLARGRVDTGGDHRVVLVPVAALSELERVLGGEPTKKLARAVGVSFGRRVADKLGAADGVAAASLEAFVTALATEVAVAGWGSLQLERWGKALVLSLDHAPEVASLALAALLEGAVEASTAREVHAVALESDPSRHPAGAARVVLLSAKTAERARLWLAQGVKEHEVLERLHETKPSGGAA